MKIEIFRKLVQRCYNVMSYEIYKENLDLEIFEKHLKKVPVNKM